MFGTTFAAWRARSKSWSTVNPSSRLYKARMCAISDKARRSGVRPRVACIEWQEPLMAVGNWMPELIEMAGGMNLLGEPGKHSGYFQWTDLVTADPDVIVISPCGFDLARTEQADVLVDERPEWPDCARCKTDACISPMAISTSTGLGPGWSRRCRFCRRSCTPKLSSRNSKVQDGENYDSSRNVLRCLPNVK